jgi:CO/xanthine dehydrogenase FAD-binding subunit
MVMAMHYTAPRSVNEMLQALSRPGEGAKIIAGGTDLIVQMRAGTLRPTLIVDLKYLPLTDIREDSTSVTVGARVTHTQLADSEVIRRHFPALAAACRLVGGPATRNRGTLGGNVMNASPAADALPPLAIYDAHMTIASRGGSRNVSFQDFFVGYRRTAVSTQEFLQEIRLVKPGRPSASEFIKQGLRRALHIATVNVAARIDVDQTGVVHTARIALGSVAPVIVRARAAEELLLGKRLTMDTIDAAARCVIDAASPISDLRASGAYRRATLAVLARRALTNVCTQLGESVHV